MLGARFEGMPGVTRIEMFLEMYFILFISNWMIQYDPSVSLLLAYNTTAVLVPLGISTTKLNAE
jgi:hypothetical protein